MAKFITKKQEYLLTLWMFKYYPVVGSFFMWLYVGLLALDNHFLVLEHNIVGNSFIGIMCLLFLMINFVLIFVSDILCFCWLHRAMFAFMGLVGSCISYEYFIGFGAFLIISRIIVFYIGIFLLAYTILKWNYFVNNCRKI